MNGLSLANVAAAERKWDGKDGKGKGHLIGFLVDFMKSK
jgi:hypothetical protein